MSVPSGPEDPFQTLADAGPLDRGEWLDLATEISNAVRGAMLAASFGDDGLEQMAAAMGIGAGDVTFGIDAVAEGVVEQWFDRYEGPVSLLTEDAGWRHSGEGAGSPADGFDHGGPRIAIDPIDGTRHLMHDMRSAWVVVSGAGPGAGEPRLSELDFGILVEIPDSRGGFAREIVAVRGHGAVMRQIELGTGAPDSRATGRRPVVPLDSPWRPVRTDDDLRLEHGYFPFFGFEPAPRVLAQELARRTFDSLHAEHDIDVASILDDQYISSGGQLALLAQGTYRSIVDARLTLGRTLDSPGQTSKPYDVGGAILIAREAGCIVELPSGGALDFPIDVTTPVEFVGYANEATRNAMAPHVAAALKSMAERD